MKTKTKPESGKITTTDLYSATTNAPYTVVSAPDIGLLNGMGIRTGTSLEISNRYAFGGPVVLRVENAYSLAIGKDVAREIVVTPA